MLRQFPSYKYILAACDYVLLLGAWVAAILLRFYEVPISDLLERQFVMAQGALILIYSLIWIVIFQHFNLYKLNLFMSFGEQVIAIFKSLIYGLVGLIVITFTIKQLDFVESRLVLALFVAISLVSIVGFRTIVFRRLFTIASQKKNSAPQGPDRR